MLYEITTLDVTRWPEYKALALEAVMQDPYAYTGIESEILAIEDDEWAARLRKAIEPEGNCILFVFDNTTIIGTAGFLLQSNEKLRHAADVVSVYIKPAYRGKGIGKALLQALIDRARTYSFLEHLVLMVTTTQTAAITLYESLGFTKVGILPKNMKIEGTYCDQQIMVKFFK